MALRRGVEDQIGAAAVGSQLPEVPGLAPHLACDVMEQSSGRSHPGRQIPAAKAVERLDFEMAQQNFRRGLGLEQVSVHRRMLRKRGKKLGLMVGDQNLGRAHAGELVQ